METFPHQRMLTRTLQLNQAEGFTALLCFLVKSDAIQLCSSIEGFYFEIITTKSFAVFHISTFSFNIGSGDLGSFGMFLNLIRCQEK